MGILKKLGLVNGFFLHRDRRWFGLILMVQAALMAIAAWHNQGLLNTDAIAYLRIAEYYATGQTQLMISGYWGPLISWLMAPWLTLGASPFTAARVVMGFSGFLFLLGTHYLLVQLKLGAGARMDEVAAARGPRRGEKRHQLAAAEPGAGRREGSSLLVGTAIAALTGAVWSVTEITPDLMLAGLVALALGQMLSDGWAESRWRACTAGITWGLAYCCKAVGLPIALISMGGLGGLWWLTRRDQRRQVIRHLLLTLLGLGLIASPWIGTISAKYQRLTFSTSAAIGHAIVGPTDVNRFHPFALQFRAPPTGRLTVWEDPSNLPYRYWSFWDNTEYARHQLALIASNVKVAYYRIREMDLIGLGVVAVACGLVMLVIQGIDAIGHRALVGAGGRWCWLVIPVAALMGTYLPVYAAEARFYYPTFPCLLALGMGAVEELRQLRPQLSRLRSILVVLAFVCFAGPAMIRLEPALRGFEDPAVISAWDLAHRLEQAGLKGPMAGSGMIQGQRTGLYAAFILGVPWCGDEPQPLPDDFLRCGAAIMVFNRADPAAASFLAHASFRNLDPVLFGDAATSAKYPLQALARIEDRR
jgi:hypothetical protein